VSATSDGSATATEHRLDSLCAAQVSRPVFPGWQNFCLETIFGSGCDSFSTKPRLFWAKRSDRPKLKIITIR